jgi:hypothetical protein
MSGNVSKSKSKRLVGIVVGKGNVLILDVGPVTHAAGAATAASHKLGPRLSSDSLDVTGVLGNQACRCAAAALEGDDGLIFLVIGFV